MQTATIPFRLAKVLTHIATKPGKSFFIAVLGLAPAIASGATNTWNGLGVNSNTGSNWDNTSSYTGAGVFSSTNTLDFSAINSTGPVTLSSTTNGTINASGLVFGSTTSATTPLFLNINGTGTAGQTTLALASGSTISLASPVDTTVTLGSDLTVRLGTGTTTINIAKNNGVTSIPQRLPVLVINSLLTGGGATAIINTSSVVSYNASFAAPALVLTNNSSTFDGSYLINGLFSYTTINNTGTGAGTSSLGTSNLSTGGVSITNGAFSYVGSGNQSTNRSITYSATAYINNFASSASNLTLNGTLSSSSGSANTVVLGVSSGNTITLNSTLATSTGGGATSLTKADALSFYNANGIYTAGDGSGTLILTATNTYAGATTLQAGTLQVGNGTSGSISSSSALVLGGTSQGQTAGGTFTVYGKSSGSTSQTVNGVTVDPGAWNVTVNANGGSGTTLALGSILRYGTANTIVGYGTVDFSTTGTGSITSSTTTNTNGILGGYATFGGNTWAVAPSVSGSAITGLASGSYTTTVSAGTTAANYASKNIDVTSSTVLAGAITPNSFRFNTADAETLTLTGTNTLGAANLAGASSGTFGAGGILVTSAVGNNLSTITGGTLVAPASTSGTAENDLIVFQNNTSAGLTISSIIANSTKTTSLTKSGPGLLTLASGANTYTGLTTINGGTLQYSSGNLGTGNIIINSGTLESTNANAITANIVLNGAGTIQSDSGTLTLFGAAVQTNASLLTISGSGNTSISATISSTFGNTGSGAGLTKTGSGTLTLSGSNTYTGITTIGAGTLSTGTLTSVGSAQPLGQDSSAIVLGGASTTGTLSYTGNTASFTRGFTVGAGGGEVDTTTSGQTLTIQSGTIDNTSGGLFTVGGAGNTTITRVVGNGSGGLTKTGAGTLTLSAANTYTGLTTVSAGTLAESSSGSIADASGVTVNGATAIFDLGANHNDTVAGVVLDGGGKITGTGISALTGSAYDVRSGSASAILAGGGALTKSTSGTVTLTGNNTYTGGTTDSGGALYINNGGGASYTAPSSSALRPITATNSSGSGTGTGSVTVASGATLGGSGTIAPTSGGVTVQSGGTLASGALQTAYAYASSGNGSVNGTGTGGGLTINNPSNLSSALTINGGATLSFALGSSTTYTGGSGALNFANPNTNSTYLSLAGNTADQIFSNSSTATTINLFDLTNGVPAGGVSLTLRSQNPYLLIQTALGDNSDFNNLWTTGGKGQNGYVLGVSTGVGNNYTAFNLAAYDINGVLISSSTNLENLRLYLYNGDLEVVPEPGTWALMLGGIALLVLLQRARRSKDA